MPSKITVTYREDKRKEAFNVESYRHDNGDLILNFKDKPTIKIDKDLLENVNIGLADSELERINS